MENETNDPLMGLVNDIDGQILNWLLGYEIPPSALVAIILARLMALVKESAGEDSFLVLLEAVKSSILDTPSPKTHLH